MTEKLTIKSRCAELRFWLSLIKSKVVLCLSLLSVICFVRTLLLEQTLKLLGRIVNNTEKMCRVQIPACSNEGQRHSYSYLMCEIMFLLCIFRTDWREWTHLGRNEYYNEALCIAYVPVQVTLSHCDFICNILCPLCNSLTDF